MSQNKEERMKNYYAELKKVVEHQNNNKIIKVCNKIIAENENELEAWQCKLTAHILLNDFQGGLNSLKKCKIVEKLMFEKAYCEYRLNNVKDAWNTIKEASSDSSICIKELQAQILYRLEHYDDCFDVYRDLIKNTSDEFDQERLTNLSAVSVNRIYEGAQKEVSPNLSLETYEQLYNNGCELLGLGKAQDALKILQQAESMCRVVMTQQDSATDEEINEEVAVIRVQQAHCQQLLKRDKESLQLYNSVLKTKPDDPALLAIINNNMACSNKEGNVFDSKKRFKTATSTSLAHKLSSRQRATIALNHCLFRFNNQEDILSETSNLVETFPSLCIDSTIITAAYLGRNGKHTEAISLLKKFTEENEQYALISLLSGVQILLMQKLYGDAAKLLTTLSENEKYRKGILSALVVLCDSSKNDQLASQELSNAAQWHKNSSGNKKVLGDLWRRTADYHLRLGNPRDAANALEELRTLDPTNRNTLAQLISAYSQFDPETAQKLSQELPDPHQLISNIDTEALEVSFSTKYVKKQAKDSSEKSPIATSAKKLSTPTDRKKKKSQKKRKINLPKNYVEGETPDPERWLPRWQRKGYKKKRDRRVKDVMKGTQGVSSEQADKFDITKTAGQHGTAKSGHTAAGLQAESGYKRTIQKKKGKKKK